MPKTEAELHDFLAELGIEATTVRHPPLFTVEESQALRGEIAGAHTKNLFLKDKKDQFFLLSVEESAAVDLKTVHKLIGAASRVSFGSADKLHELLGVRPGAVTLLGAINDTAGRVRVVVDARLMEAELVNVHPLTNEATTSIRPDDLLRFLRATSHEPAVLPVSA